MAQMLKRRYSGTPVSYRIRKFRYVHTRSAYEQIQERLHSRHSIAQPARTRSHSNLDIDYSRSAENYDLSKNPSANHAETIQNRIDDLRMGKAVRKDAVHMCGLIVSSDTSFFYTPRQRETRRLFEESAAFLTDFVGKENVISAIVHMDEKTPHMHSLHVPVTPGGRLSANSIYTHASLKKLQLELPCYLQDRSFDIQRGVEQKPDSAKKHLDTREFRQQQEALNNLILESEEPAQSSRQIIAALEQHEEELKKNIETYERQAEEKEVDTLRKKQAQLAAEYTAHRKQSHMESLNTLNSFICSSSDLIRQFSPF